jgi:phosphosulfolactate synthase
LASKSFLGFIPKPERPKKPRTIGITMVIDPIQPLVLERYSEFVDIVKLVEATLWAPNDVIKQAITTYHKHGIDVQIGGVPFEMARAAGKEEEFLKEVKNLGLDIVEYETHALKPTVDKMRSDVKALRKRGFRVVGEVGAKWPWKDHSRIGRDRIDVQKTVNAFATYLDAGCEKTYWEGLIVANLIGRHLENKEGQKALLEVANTIGPEKIAFELWGPTMAPMQPPIMWSWLVYQFGPQVNIGNVYSDGVRLLESVRRGTSFEMDHPYVRWLSEQRPTRDWWRMEAPPYDEYLEKT